MGLGEKSTKFIFQCSLTKFEWNTAMPILSHTDHGCFYALMTELGNCDRDHMACKTKKNALSGPSQNCWPTPLNKDLSPKAMDHMAIPSQPHGTTKKQPGLHAQIPV